MIPGLPPVAETEFIVRLPLGLTPRTVTAGYDAPEEGPARSFLLDLTLDWTADAPRIVRAVLGAYCAGIVEIPVPPEQVRLAVGPGPADYDLFNEEENSFLCYVTFGPRAAA
jgi:hypothetical protein